MQCLAEDRWEDYEWRYNKERFAYWNQGFSWIERPEMDQIGLQAQRSMETMTTLPALSSDLAFYICKAENLSVSELTLKNGDTSEHFGDIKPKMGNKLLEPEELPQGRDITASTDHLCITVPV